jgi:hypothetical protein
MRDVGIIQTYTRPVLCLFTHFVVIDWPEFLRRWSKLASEAQLTHHTVAVFMHAKGVEIW